MTLYTEGIVWYLIFIDCIIYNIMAWTKKKWHFRDHHWLSNFFPLHRFWGLFYFILVIWLGYTLYRMELLGFYLG